MTSLTPWPVMLRPTIRTTLRRSRVLRGLAYIIVCNMEVECVRISPFSISGLLRLVDS